MRLFASSLAALALAASIGCTAAKAGTFNYTNYTVLSPVTVGLVDAHRNVYSTASAGQITLYPSIGAALSTFCFDIQHDLTRAGTLTTGTFLTGAMATSINALLSNALPLLASDRNVSAALQVAIWKTEYGSELSVYSSNSAVLSKASSYIGNLASGLWKADATKAVAFLNGNGIDQSQIYLTALPNAVPEPATLSILGLGLAGLVALRRRVTRSPAMAAS